MIRVTVIDVRTGQPVHTKATSSLKNLKHTLQDCGVTSKGCSKTDPGQVTYIYDDDWTPQQVHDLQSAVRKYESPYDVSEYGLEFYLYHDLYLTDYERTQLVHYNEKNAFAQEDKLHDALTEEDKRLAKVFEAIRQRQVTIVCVNPDGDCSNGRGYGEDLLTRLMPTTDAVPFQSPKYHRIRA